MAGHGHVPPDQPGRAMTSSRLAPADPGEVGREGTAVATRTPERATDSIARVREMMAIVRGDAKHAAAAQSTADALWVLYDRVLRLSPDAGDERSEYYPSKLQSLRHLVCRFLL